MTTRRDKLRLLDEFERLIAGGRLSRREIIRGGTALGLSAPVIGSLLRFTPGAAAQGEPITMVGWGYSPEVVQDNVTNFEEAYDETVEYQLTTGGNYHQIVETKLLGGERPAMWYSESEYIYRWSRAGFIRDVEGMESESTEFYKEEMLPVGVSGLSMPTGELMGLPYYSGYNAFVYNREHLDQAGFDPPTTWEEMMEQARELQAEGISAHPFLSAQNHEWASLSWSIFAIWYSQGAYVFDENFEPTFADDPAFRGVIEMHKQWLDEGITPPDILTHETESVPAFLTGNHTYMVVHDYDQRAFNLGEDSNVKGMVGNAPMPGTTGETFAWTAAYLLGADNTVDPARTWNLMQWLGGKAKDGEFHGVKRWALERGLGTPHREVLDDPEVIEAWSEWRDMDVHVQQLENSRGRAVEKTMWFPEWNWQMMTEVQEYMQGQRSIDEVITNLVDLVAELKDLYPEG
jgi:multiple sugar transport system substrate-binding protein